MMSQEEIDILIKELEDEYGDEYMEFIKENREE